MEQAFFQVLRIKSMEMLFLF